jgi:hypothetical protein
MTKLGTRPLFVALQGSTLTASSGLATASHIHLIPQDLQGLRLSRSTAGASNYVVNRVFFTRQQEPKILLPRGSTTAQIHALVSILSYEADGKSLTKQRLTVNHATMQPKSLIRGMNFYRAARLQPGLCDNAGAVGAYVFRESAFGQT